MMRVGPMHYNTVEEIHKFGEALESLATVIYVDHI
jgi:selenocysteine lyase/cysteine desulfurase